MPIINGARVQRKEKIKAEINGDIFDKINSYCAWAQIEDIADFIQEAAVYVFKKDRDWKRYSKSLKRAQAQQPQALAVE